MSTPPDLSDFSKEEIKESLNEIRFPFEVAVYSSENYFNFGSIVRNAHGFLCSKIWMVDFTKFYKKASMCTHKWENIEKATLHEFLEQTKDRNIVVFERRGDLPCKDLRDFIYPENPILFFGAEKWGVPDEIVNAAHSIVTIPMFGLNNDLNVAVAAGIAMYDYISKTT
jgi:tRNA G18 (ribose-2'-O)-methylase SpoU